MISHIGIRFKGLLEFIAAVYTSRVFLLAVLVLLLSNVKTLCQLGVVAASTPTEPAVIAQAKDQSHEIFNPGETDLVMGATFRFRATAYCLNGITASGVSVEPGIVAADPEVLPLGTWIHVEAPGHDGFYRVMDTGLKIKGNRLDIYMPSKEMALAFGIQDATVTILSPALVRQARLATD